MEQEIFLHKDQENERNSLFFRRVIAQLARELEDAQHELVSLRAKSLRDQEQLRMLRNSFSWRVTSPLRIRFRRVKDFF